MYYFKKDNKNLIILKSNKTRMSRNSEVLIFRIRFHFCAVQIPHAIQSAFARICNASRHALLIVDVYRLVI